MESLVSELKSSMMWSDSCVAVVRHIWKEEGPALCGKPKETLLVGQVCNGDSLPPNSCFFHNAMGI